MSEGQMMELVIVRVGEISFGTENTFSGSRWMFNDDC